MLHAAWLGILVALASYALTGTVRRYAWRRAMLDIPTERSAHRAPTPRGGGLAIVLVVSTGLVLAVPLGWVTARLAVGLGVGGALVAAIGWLDDRHGVSPARRLAVHLAAAACLLLATRGLPDLAVGTSRVGLGMAGVVLGLLGIVWMINLYNFMDGIDGLAAGEAVSAGFVTAVLLWFRAAPGLSLLVFLVTCASGGFLVWNWAPAKIFLGDVGSGFLGFMFAGLALASERAHAVPALLWALIFGVFIFDATVTLARRAWRGERWYTAHATHAYQRAVQAGWTHAAVTRFVMASNVALASLAVLGLFRPNLLIAALVIGGVFLASAYAWVEGRRPMQRSEAGA